MLARATPLIFGDPAPLPRGPHSLSRDEVAASHRTRLMLALTQTVAERGYGKATITGTARAAGVSPNVFYEHFADVEACYLAAYDVFAAALLQRVAASLDAEDIIETALRAYLAALDAEPVLARAFLVEIDAVGAQARARRRTAYAQFAALLKAAHARVGGRPLPDSGYLGVVHGIRALACDAIERGDARTADLAPEMLVWLRATFGDA